MTDEQMRARPGDRVNSLVWLLWHMARTKDVAVNLVSRAASRSWTDDWRRMNVPWRTIGTGMTEGEVAELTRRADVDAVRAYRSAVGRQTQEVVSALRPDAWDEIVGLADTARAAAAGAFAANTHGSRSGLPAVARPCPRRSARRLRHPAQRRPSR